MRDRQSSIEAIRVCRVHAPDALAARGLGARGEG
jgi:hypothetical protein